MRRWWAARPLRTRLTASAIALLALVLALIAVACTVTIRAFLMGQLDQRVAEAGRRAGPDVVYFVSPLPAPGGEPEGLEFLRGPGVDPRALGVRLHPDGRTDAGVLADAALRGLTDAQTRAVSDVPVDGAAHTRAVPGLGDYRLIAVRTGTPGETVVTGVPMDTLQDTVSRVVVIEVVLSAAGLIAAGTAFVPLVRLSLGPLRRIAGTALRVSGQTLHQGEVGSLERVPAADTDPRTEVGQVGASLNRLLGHVSAALAARQASETRVRRFVADASHELRTPLASIRGYAELTRRGREEIPPDAAHALRRVEAEATRMTALVEDLLLLARLDAGRPLDPARVDLSPLVIDAVGDARAAGPGHHWRLDLPDDPVPVRADPARLHQVLVNLLANARTHTPPGTVVTAAVRRAGPEAVIRVTDNGPGIPPRVLPTVFERFARGDGSRSRAAGSTGLGLAIVEAVVAAHGGTVAVGSVPGRTVFTVTWPIAEEPTTGPDTDVDPQAGRRTAARATDVEPTAGAGPRSQPSHSRATRA
ncbi:HAMP domain-containing sensor histidine kinase [Streptomyces sp. DSM 44917]|uniref:histidine kinase n=1 Tax=Streptomyces boetiae TaxID=3075541 RepID=A0ABU2LBX5_9ACTN|nr:HAMP domain-containing sensor histidine kinase [Streptomyces sp. DSM 44917]MDT0309059.1 HAMP domain-containing sensor histidine kinase [Streptomyces sp. DSM 44917]